MINKSIPKPLAQDILTAYYALFSAVENGTVNNSIDNLREEVRSIQDRVSENDAIQTEFSHYRIFAFKNMHSQGELEFDKDAIVSLPEELDNEGAYVECWLWISKGEIQEKEEISEVTTSFIKQPSLWDSLLLADVIAIDDRLIHNFYVTEKYEGEVQEELILNFSVLVASVIEDDFQKHEWRFSNSDTETAVYRKEDDSWIINGSKLQLYKLNSI